MKICICCSLTFTDEVQEVAKMLEKMGHEVLLPNGVINRLAEKPGFDPIRAKIETDSCHAHIDKIRAADAILVCNFLKNCVPGYIGANTFAEMFVAHYYDKPIFSLFSLPDDPYIADEINSFGVRVLNNDLSGITESWWSAPISTPAPELTVTPEPEEPAQSPSASAETDPKTPENPETPESSEKPEAPAEDKKKTSAPSYDLPPAPIIIAEGQTTLPLPDTPAGVSVAHTAPLPPNEPAFDTPTGPQLPHSVFTVPNAPAKPEIQINPAEDARPSLVKKFTSAVKKFTDFASGKTNA